jgi:hypothetical protein
LFAALLPNLVLLCALPSDQPHRIAFTLRVVQWPALAPGLTSLVWHDIRKPDGWDAALAHAAALEAQAEPMEGAELFQAVALPLELSRLQQLRELRVEYAQLDAVPPAVQVIVRM